MSYSYRWSHSLFILCTFYLMKNVLYRINKSFLAFIVFASNVLNFQKNISKDHFNVLVNDNFTPGLSFYIHTYVRIKDFDTILIPLYSRLLFSNTIIISLFHYKKALTSHEFQIYSRKMIIINLKH